MCNTLVLEDLFPYFITIRVDISFLECFLHVILVNESVSLGQVQRDFEKEGEGLNAALKYSTNSSGVSNNIIFRVL